MIRKLIVMLLILTMTVGLAGCKERKTTSENTSKTEKSKEEKTKEDKTEDNKSRSEEKNDEVYEMNRYYIINKTDMNISDISVSFETSDEGISIFSLCANEKINQGETKNGELKAVDFGKDYAELAVKVTFEGKEEIYYFDGLFYDTFDGTVILEFYKAEDQLRLKAKANTGTSQGDVLLDEEIYIDWSLEDMDYWDWVDSED